jgi:hypothetical protein
MTTPITTELRSTLEPTGHDDFADELSPAPSHRELDRRTTDGITVVLLWTPGGRDVLLRVDDAKTGVRFELPVAGADAIDAFHHPFAYAA